MLLVRARTRQRPVALSERGQHSSTGLATSADIANYCCGGFGCSSQKAAEPAPATAESAKPTASKAENTALTNVIVVLYQPDEVLQQRVPSVDEFGNFTLAVPDSILPAVWPD